MKKAAGGHGGLFCFVSGDTRSALNQTIMRTTIGIQIKFKAIDFDRWLDPGLRRDDVEFARGRLLAEERKLKT
ncbi:MAG TPA: hypothetical protein PKE16_16565 [Hyphomicrobium sp.]|nr:hypothetical protein [Hyphomicrobium sp.]